MSSDRPPDPQSDSQPAPQVEPRLSPGPESRPAPVWVNLLLLLVVVVFCLGAAEGILRWADLDYFKGSRAYHAELGWTAKPEQVLYLRRPEAGTVRYATNRKGFRDIEHRGASIPVRRITVIGDSFTEAAEVDDVHTFTSRLKTRLNLARQDKKQYWEVKRLGMGDFGSLQALLALRRYGLAPKPEVVIFQIFPYNDILNNSRSGAYWVSNQDAYRPYLDADKNFQEITYLNPTVSWWRRHSHLARFSLLLAQQYVGPPAGERLFKNNGPRLEWLQTQLPELGMPADMDPTLLPMNTFSPPAQQMPAVAEGWQATLQTLRRVERLVHKRGAKLVVLVIPHGRQLSRVLHRRAVEMPFEIDPAYAEKELTAALDGTPARVVPLLDQFEEHLDTVFPFVDGHLNIATHDLVAERLFQELVDAGWADGPELEEIEPAPKTDP